MKLSSLVREVNGNKFIIPWQSKEINYQPSFQVLEYLPTIEKQMGEKLPPATDLHTPEAQRIIHNLAEKYHVPIKAPFTTARMLDKLAEKFVEPLCQNPTFVINHPVISSPLAKEHRSIPGVVERFEVIRYQSLTFKKLFVAGMELCNSYTELNNPFVQRQRFKAQEMERTEKKDDESQITDEHFCTALEYGLPPTGGWGLGIGKVPCRLTFL